MSNLTGDQIFELIEKSGLITADSLTKALADFEAEVGPEAKTEGPKFIEYLQRVGLVTEWQSEKLLQGRHKGFFLGNYKLLRHLGSGGMSAVFLSEHKHMRQRRAIKVLPQARVNDSSYLGRFYREARAAAALDHPNIVRAYDVDNDGDNHFLVMEYVEGNDLQKIVSSGGVLPYETAAEYMRQSAAGLVHAHQVGLIHRDIKPANLLVDPKGVVKVLDMGLARFADDEKQASLTQVHEENVLGTADYLAPEQAINSHTVDARADIYSLGCTFYFALTGHPPFNEGTLTQRLLMHQQKEPPSITIDRPDAPRDLLAICKKMMAKKLDERYQNAGEVEHALTQWLIDRGAMRPSQAANYSAPTAGAGANNANRQAPANPGARQPGSPPTGQRIIPKGRIAGDGGPPVGDTLSGQGQATTKGPAGKKPGTDGKTADGRKNDPNDSPSKIGKKIPMAKALGADTAAPPAANPKASPKTNNDSSGAFNFNINTGGDSDVLSSKQGKKGATKPGESGKTGSGKGLSDKPASGSGKGSAAAKAPAPTPTPTPVKGQKSGPTKGNTPAVVTASAEAAKTDPADPAAPKPKLRRKRKVTAKDMWLFGLGVLIVSAGLVAALVYVLNSQEAQKKAEREAKEAAAAAKPTGTAKSPTAADAPAPVAAPASTAPILSLPKLKPVAPPTPADPDAAPALPSIPAPKLK
ncbi:MAG: serine/threonine protein kinase [Planctomycetia bacterium]|nr:serine/threonine protein kinase [Planctomycetia bacterium]